jgi:HK97 family phage major capsid protein
MQAYALLTVKALDAPRRTITGIATTPEPDRVGDIFDPLGATFRNPLPLLVEHDRRLVVGTVVLDPPTAAGVTFTASIPVVDTPGELQTRTQTVWDELVAGLRWGVSIGFHALTNGVAKLATGGLHYRKTEIFELSLVAIPAHQGATVLTVKSLCGGSMTLSEQITAVEAARAVPATQLGTLAAGGLATADARADFDRLDGEVKSFDEQLMRLRRAEALQGTQARPIAAPVPGALPRVTVEAPRVEPGTDFVRYAMCKAFGRGDSAREIAYAAQWRESTPTVELVLKAAVAPATTTTAAWAGALVPSLTTMSAAFIELIMPATILGRLTGLLRCPFNCRVPVELAGGIAKWVGQKQPKPVTQFAYTEATLPEYKVATIVTLTDELARNSSPAAETVFRRRLTAVITQFLDQQFIDPAVAEVAGINPGSITNGITGTPGTADAWADIAALLAQFTTDLIPLSGVTLIMSEANAFALSMQKDRNGNLLFPSVSATGGSIMGVKTIVSQTAGALVVGVVPSYILYADDGATTIDVSREASLQMNDAPVDPVDPATTAFTSLWQNNLIGLKAERYIAWKRASNDAVNYLTAVAWPNTPPALP